MNIIDTSQISDPNVAQPFLGTSLNFLQHSTMEGLSNTILALMGNSYSNTQVYVLWGCVRSAPVDGTAGTVTVSAGAIFYAGEIFTCPAQSITQAAGTGIFTIWPIVPAFTYVDLNTGHLIDPITFSDNIPRSVHQVRQWILTAASSYPSFPQGQQINWIQLPINTTINQISGIVNGGWITIQAPQITNTFSGHGLNYNTEFASTFTLGYTYLNVNTVVMNINLTNMTVNGGDTMANGFVITLPSQLAGPSAGELTIFSGSGSFFTQSGSTITSACSLLVNVQGNQLTFQPVTANGSITFGSGFLNIFGSITYRVATPATI